MKLIITINNWAFIAESTERTESEIIAKDCRTPDDNPLLSSPGTVIFERKNILLEKDMDTEKHDNN